MKLIDKLEHAIDELGASGVTIWLLPDGRVQANVCRPDRVSWVCLIGDEVQETLDAVLDQFNDRKARAEARKRVVKVSQKRRRDISDLA